MSIISTVAPSEATGQVAQVYAQVEQALGRLPNAMKLYSASPDDCAYCIGMNEAMLIQRAGFTPEQTAAAKRNPADSALPDQDKAMLLFVLKATKTPKAVNTGDLDALRTMGWTDRDILDAVNHGARNVAVDILFNTFKIENDF
jgi:alkylhydroperoxidase family enzyme